MSLKEDIIKLRNEGKSFGEIQTILGCSKGTISYHLKSTETTTKAEVSPVATTTLQDKALTYVNNYKTKRPCNSCGQYLHESQLDPADDTAVDAIISAVVDKETLEEAKLKVSQLKFICANCDRLRKFRAAN